MTFGKTRIFGPLQDLSSKLSYPIVFLQSTVVHDPGYGLSSSTIIPEDEWLCLNWLKPVSGKLIAQ